MNAPTKAVSFGEKLVLLTNFHDNPTPEMFARVNAVILEGNEVLPSSVPGPKDKFWSEVSVRAEKELVDEFDSVTKKSPSPLAALKKLGVLPPLFKPVIQLAEIYSTHPAYSGFIQDRLVDLVKGGAEYLANRLAEREIRIGDLLIATAAFAHDDTLPHLRTFRLFFDFFEAVEHPWGDKNQQKRIDLVSHEIHPRSKGFYNEMNEALNFASVILFEGAVLQGDFDDARKFFDAKKLFDQGFATIEEVNLLSRAALTRIIPTTLTKSILAKVAKDANALK